METWKFLLFLRIALIFFPLYGYIHPDEFFQGPEVAAGDFLDYEVYHSWEFNGTFPIRSIISSHYSSIFSSIVNKYPNYSRLLIILPRLVMVITSFFNDFALFRLSLMLKLNPHNNLSVFGSSHITLSLFSRSLSNNLEAALFSLLLYLVFKSKYINGGHLMNTETCMIALIIVTAIFVRPTFVLFAIVPVIFWFSSNVRKAVLSLLTVSMPILLSLVFIVSLDTIYYRYDKSLFLFLYSIYSLNPSDFVITPLNFINYNLKRDNLEKHGLHPFYLHIIVNFPLMFNIVGVLAVYKCLQYSFKFLVGRSTGICKLNALGLALMCLVPVLLLTLIPHQEPRFLIPLLVPLTVLFGGTIFRSKFLWCIWILGNLFCGLLFGVLHQGGLIPCLLHLAKVTKETSHPVEIIFFHTYMPPRHILQLQNGQNRVHVKDIGGSQTQELYSAVYSALTESKEVYVALPSSILTSLKSKEFRVNRKTFIFEETILFFPHLSTEDPPVVKKFYECGKTNYSFWSVMNEELSLGLLKSQLIESS